MAEFGGDLKRFTARAVDTVPIHHIVRFTGAGPTTNIASHAAATFANGAIGVSQQTANSGDHLAVGYSGESKVTAGDAVTAGRLFTTNGSGRAIHAVSGDLAVGRAMTAAGADGEVFRGMLFSPFRLSGTN